MSTARTTPAQNPRGLTLNNTFPLVAVCIVILISWFSPHSIIPYAAHQPHPVFCGFNSPATLRCSPAASGFLWFQFASNPQPFIDSTVKIWLLKSRACEEKTALDGPEPVREP